jgi:hypothetical protein
MQTEKPYWLEESYSDAISVSDTGIMARNIHLARTAKVIFSLTINVKEKFLDYGGGYGIFTRLMRDYGFDFYWYDKYATNLVSRGFEGELDNKRYEAITSFENFEHFENPIEEIEKIFSLTNFVLFSTELIPETVPTTDNWWYYCLEHGQHISLFSRKSLEFIAQKHGYHLTTNGTNLHIFSKKQLFPKIFLLEKIIHRFGVDSLFKLMPKTNNDMLTMIQKMDGK